MGSKIRDGIGHILRLKQAVGLVWESGKGWAAATLAVVLVQGFLPVAALLIMRAIIDTVTLAASAEGNADFSRVGLYIAVAGAIGLTTVIAQSLARFVSEAQSQAVTDHIHEVLHAKSIELDLEYYETPRFHDALYRAQHDAPFRPTRIVAGLMQIGRDGLALIGMASVLFGYSAWLSVVLVAAGVPAIFTRVRHAKRNFQWQAEHTSDERKAGYYHWLLTGDTTAKELRLFGLGSLFINRYQHLRETLRKERRRIALQRMVAELLPQALAIAALFGSYAFIAFNTVQGKISLGQMVMFYEAFRRGQSYIAQLLTRLAALYEDSLFLSSLDQFLNLESKVTVSEHPQPAPEPMQKGVVLDSVAFCYPGRQTNALTDVSLSIAPNQVVALVGHNGSGKTTLVKLLCRLYDPTQGTITVDGADLRELDLVAWRRQLGVIFQDFVHYNLTARENIWVADAQLDIQDERIKEAARQADADSIIARLQHGYDTPLGRWFEDGIELSIGEWQRVALARAFLRQAQLLILDEPTSDMDPQAEADVFAKLHEVLGSRSALLISHRFSTVRLADHIYVLEDGRISEHGSHEELLAGDRTYARLYNLQASSFR